MALKTCSECYIFTYISFIQVAKDKNEINYQKLSGISMIMSHGLSIIITLYILNIQLNQTHSERNFPLCI